MSEPIWTPPAGPMKDEQRVAALRKILTGASPEVKRAAIRIALHESLEAARADYTRAYEARQTYKAKVIAANAKGTKEVAERLDEALGVADALCDLASLAVRALDVVDLRRGALDLALAQLDAVCGVWKGGTPGVERGEFPDSGNPVDSVKRGAEQMRRKHAQP